MDTNIPISEQEPRPANLQVPGPRGLGVVWAFLDFKRKGVVSLEDMARQYGALSSIHFLGYKAYLVARPDLISHVLVQNRDNYLKWQGTKRAQLFFGTPMQTNNGEAARRQRQTMGVLFRPERIRLFGETMLDSTQQMLDAWTAGEVRNINQDMQALTLDIAMQLHFGALDEAVSATIKQSFFEAIGLLDDFLRPPLWTPTPRNRRFFRAMAELDAALFALITARRKVAEEGQRDLLSGLVSLRDADGNGLSDKQIRDELVSMLSAGYFPTATALIQTLRLLAAHPEADERLAEEFLQCLAGKPAGADDLKQLAYLDKVVKESLRLCPPAGGMVRIVDKEDRIDGWPIPAKAMVFISQWVMQHSKDYFKEPEAFKPERWTQELASSLPDFVYFPFGWGSRACIGQVWGMMEIQIILASVLQRFRLSSTTPAQAGQVDGVTIDSIQEQGGLCLRLSDRISKN